MAELNGKILVVDDEYLVRWSICRHLESLGYTVFGAGSCDEAMEILQREPSMPLVITDLAMPEKNGVELMHLARALSPGVTFLVVTGTTSTDMMEKAQKEGVWQTFSKPFDLREISAAVEKIIPAC